MSERLSRRSRGVAKTVASALLVGAGALWADEAVLVGGGHELQASQGQIELNVDWVGNILRARDMPVTTFFTDGDETGPDVHYRLPGETPAGLLEPLARVFGDLDRERRRYRNHALPDVAGTTRRDALERDLGDVLERTAEEPLLLVYNGHGSQSPDNDAGVTLDLWGKTAMTARELHALVGERRGASESPLRYVFTQCYSGGFHRLAHADSDAGLELSDGLRCGFTSESAHALAEGCSAGIDIGDYRDYTTYFFAALDDRERDGTVLDRDPDVNADGAVTLREAHLHALEKAHSTDLSRSSSESWLEDWQPWFLRWLPPPANPPNNEYARLFRTLAADADIPMETGIGRTLRDRLARHESSVQALRAERAALRPETTALRVALQRSASARWPALLGPYTDGYRELAASGELERIAEWLAEQTSYAALVDLQARDGELESAVLGAERDATRSRKLLRLRHLATLKGQLEAYGDATDRASYARLLACEELPLVLDTGAAEFVSTDE